jgi:hypothetical protein
MTHRKEKTKRDEREVASSLRKRVKKTVAMTAKKLFAS